MDPNERHEFNERLHNSLQSNKQIEYNIENHMLSHYNINECHRTTSFVEANCKNEFVAYHTCMYNCWRNNQKNRPYDTNKKVNKCGANYCESLYSSMNSCINTQLHEIKHMVTDASKDSMIRYCGTDYTNPSQNQQQPGILKDGLAIAKCGLSISNFWDRIIPESKYPFTNSTAILVSVIEKQRKAAGFSN